ncbi:hypothetical protein H6G17_28330 [Chroococcidiopsis sp. FACHB-1243]|uniref:hypothetical protein n=1 Tax=Chroococcidiopsis sp. [FACHB-1243] TaxID=2692781 RepID=UPI0017840452|nr:hypothetical protein [Chroococcidiopsis sp. [FACHB-1243]]MBD2309366.1 hypothetical protein [Chroococcidiopsis sp. [FACHB-1243]]
MSNFSQEERSQKKLDLSAMRFKAKVMRLRACKMRIDALAIRIKTRAMREQNQNLVAIYQEWFVK